MVTVGNVLSTLDWLSEHWLNVLPVLRALLSSIGNMVWMESGTNLLLMSYAAISVFTRISSAKDHRKGTYYEHKIGSRRGCLGVGAAWHNF